jgi:hypothetical protein
MPFQHPNTRQSGIQSHANILSSYHAQNWEHGPSIWNFFFSWPEQHNSLPTQVRGMMTRHIFFLLLLLHFSGFALDAAADAEACIHAMGLDARCWTWAKDHGCSDCVFKTGSSNDQSRVRCLRFRYFFLPRNVSA